LVPARKQPGLKAGAFSPAWLVPVAETGINGLYKPGLKAFFPPVFASISIHKSTIFYLFKVMVIQQPEH
jgi:hypothetical protein